MSKFLGNFLQLKYFLKAFFYLPISYTKHVILGRDPYLRQLILSRWGILPKELLRIIQKNKSIIWIDTLALGEVNQIYSFSKLLKRSFEDVIILVTTNNFHSFQQLNKFDSVDYVLDSPWDISFIVRKVLTLLKPKALVFIENVYFPKLVKEAYKKKIPVFLLSGFFPSGWNKNPFYTRSFQQEFFTYVNKICVKSTGDAKNFEQLGVDKNKIHVLGDLKYDFEYLLAPVKYKYQLKETLHFHSKKILLAMNVHAYEIEFILQSFKKVLEANHDMKFILAPYHVGLAPKIINFCHEMGLRCVLKTNISKDASSADIVILNTYGELYQFYCISDAAFIGGSLPFNNNELAGWKGLCHSIVEPVVNHIPLFFGSNISYRKSHLNLLLNVWSGFQVRSPHEFSKNMDIFFKDPDIKKRLLETYEALLKNHQDIPENYVRFLKMNMTVGI